MKGILRLSAVLHAAIWAASRSSFGGIPLANLSNRARANHKKRWTGSMRLTHHKPNGGRERARRLAFKERHGHFA